MAVARYIITQDRKEISLKMIVLMVKKQEQPTHHVVEAGRVWSKFSTEIANYEAARILEQEGAGCR